MNIMDLLDDALYWIELNLLGLNRCQLKGCHAPRWKWCSVDHLWLCWNHWRASHDDAGAHAKSF